MDAMFSATFLLRRGNKSSAYFPGIPSLSLLRITWESARRYFSASREIRNRIRFVSFHHVFWAAIWYHSTFRFPPIVALTKRFFPPNKALKTVSRIIYSNKPLVQLSSVYKKSSLSLFTTKQYSKLSRKRHLLTAFIDRKKYFVASLTFPFKK